MDRFVCRIGTVAFYVPAFWMGVVLVLVFSVNLKLLPSSGAYGIGKSGDVACRSSSWWRATCGITPI